MNAARIAILAAAAIAAIAAAFFVHRAMSTREAPVVVQAAPEPARPVTRVLAVRQDLGAGARVRAQDLYWQAWPDEALSPAYLTEARNPGAVDEFTGSVVRIPLMRGEPVTAQKLVRPGDHGFMSAVLEPGMRAVAVPISAQTGAGGFILPNDRIDLIVTYEGDGGASARRRFYVAETVVENVRVLAIDQLITGDNQAVLGSTATLELTPDQAHAVAQAQAQGSLSLALRSLADGDGGPRMAGMRRRPAEEETGSRDGVQVYRYGRGRLVAVQND